MTAIFLLSLGKLYKSEN